MVLDHPSLLLVLAVQQIQDFQASLPSLVLLAVQFHHAVQILQDDQLGQAIQPDLLVQQVRLLPAVPSVQALLAVPPDQGNQWIQFLQQVLELDMWQTGINF